MKKHVKLDRKKSHNIKNPMTEKKNVHIGKSKDKKTRPLALIDIGEKIK
jgi:hypothetical protein